MFNNDDSQCPERHGGTNHTKVYIDSSQPLLDNPNIWREDDSLKVECYSETSTKVVHCPCNEYSVEYDSDDPVPEAVEYYSGSFKKLDRSESFDLLAPLYYDSVKQLYLFSHHPKGKVWFLGSSTDSWSMRINKLASGEDHDCPLKWKEEEAWEYLQSKSKNDEKEVWLRDTNVEIECLD